MGFVWSFSSEEDAVELMNDDHLLEVIRSKKRTLENSGRRLPDKGEKLQVSIKRLEEELEWRENRRIEKGEPIVLDVENESHPLEGMEQEDKFAECLKEAKIYYPSCGDAESIEICSTDIECLAPERYLMCTIMNFYIRYLQQQASMTNRSISDHHFFNTYFYDKLKVAVSYKQSERETFFMTLRRWWKGVNIFQKAYLLIPIHEEFLREEWSYLDRDCLSSDIPIAHRIWKNLPRRIDAKIVAVPQQKNDYDCGVFVLYFIERFLEDAPQRLKKQDMAMFGKKWFKPEEASNLRVKIHKLLRDKFHDSLKEDGVSKPDPLQSPQDLKKGEDY